MGSYNLPGTKLPKKLQNSICPLCDSTIHPMKGYATEVDSFDFRCNNCNANAIISFTGEIMDKIDTIKTDARLKFRLTYKIKKSKKTEIIVSAIDFPPYATVAVAKVVEEVE